MLIFSMSVSIDGFVADRRGSFDWGAVSDELFAFHLARVRGLGAYLCGRRLYEAMLPWEHDPAMRDTALKTEFAEVWSALPKVVFSRTLTVVQGNARLAGASLADEIETARGTSDADVEIGGAELAAAAIELDLVDELRPFRFPVVVGGGTPYLPPVTADLTFDLAESRVFDNRVIYERYRRIRAA